MSLVLRSAPAFPRRPGWPRVRARFGAWLAAALAVAAAALALPRLGPVDLAGAWPGASLPALALPERPHPPADPWAFAAPALAEMNDVALQVCAADAALRAAADAATAGRWQARKADLALAYRGMAGDYESRVADRLRGGARRPWAVPPAAPPYPGDGSTGCLEVAAALPLPAAPPRPAPIAAPGPGVQRISFAELDAYAAMAGWPMQPGWWPEMRTIVYCESGLNLYSHNASDPNGGSYGLAQLNGRQHFNRAGEDFDRRFDPVVNLRTALWLRTVRGHFGGAGGWKNCASMYGIE